MSENLVALNNVLTGGNGDDVLSGSAGADILSGGLGNDTLYGGAGDDILINDGHGIDGLWGGTGNDTYQFAFGSEVVVGDPNLGFLNHVSDAEGEGSSDTLVFTNANFDDLQFMQGYKGFRPDHLYIRNIATNEVMGVSWQFSSANPASTAGIETFVFADGSYITRAELLTLVGGGTIVPHAPLVLGGTPGDDILTGGIGNDILIGGAGADVLNGGAGTDTVSYAGSSSDVTIDLDAGTGHGGDAEGDTLSGIEVVVGSGYGDTLIASGAGGTVVLRGGAGDDVYEVRGPNVVVEEQLNSGNDTVKVSGLGSYTLSANVENLIHDGSTSFTGTGNDLDNVMTGGSGDDVLSGGVGDDTLSGGLGNDTLYGGAGDDILINDGHGIDGLWGGTGNDTYQFAFGSEVVVGDPNLGFLNHVSDAEGEGSSDTLVFTNANFDDLQFMQGYKGFRPDHLYIRNIATNEVMGVSWQFSSANPASTAGIETFVFADGSYITRAELLTLIGGGTIVPHAPGTVLNGTAGDDVLTGGNRDDLLNGGDGNDTLAGGLGNDVLHGGNGNDILIGGAGADVLNGGAGTDTVSYAGSSSGVTIDLDAGTGHGGDAEGDTLSGIEVVVGSGYGDTLTGGLGNDVLHGGNGNDILIGGAGADVLDGGAGTDTVSYAGSSSGVTIDLDAGTGYGGDARGDTLSGIEIVVGSGYGDILGASGANGTVILRGGAGDDVYEVRGPNVVVEEQLNSGNDTVKVSGVASYTLSGNVENLTHEGSTSFTGTGNDLDNIVTGGLGNDVLHGGNGNDILIGGAGADVLNGGAGTDTVSYAGSSSGVTIDLDAGTGHGGDAEGDTLSGIEVVVGSGYGDTLIASGAGGTVVLRGGAGDDVYEVRGPNVVVEEQLNSGNDTVKVSGLGSYTLSANVENLIHDGSTSFTGTGNDLDNVMTGGSGDDVLSGGVGDDTLSGGLGNDTLYGGAGDDILINDGHGIDGLWGGTGNDTYQFAFGSEVVVGDPNLGFLNHVSDAEGEGSSDTLVFTNANFDDLQFMQGYKGFRPDHLYIRNIATNEVMGVSWQFSSANPASTAGIETFVFADGSYITRAELLTLIGGGTIVPHAPLVLGGTPGDDILTGGIGNDILIGGAGADVLNGGAGTDTVSYAGSSSGVTIDLDAGTGHGGDAEGDTLSGIEVVVGSGYGDTLTGGLGNDVLHGGNGNDILIGGAGADVLDGGAGTDTVSYAGSSSGVTIDLDAGTGYGGDARGDTLSGIEIVVGSGYGDILGASGANGTVILRGGAGDDVYEVRGPNVVVEEQLNSGNDTVKVSGVASYTLSGNVENLIHEGCDGGFVGTGNDLDNTLIGSECNDTLSGVGGNDGLYGGAGDDILINDGHGIDGLWGGTGNDTYQFAFGDEVVVGDPNVYFINHVSDAEGDGSSDTLIFTNANFEDLEFLQGYKGFRPDHLYIRHTATNEVMGVSWQLSSADPSSTAGIETFVFADGRYITREELLTLVGGGTVVPHTPGSVLNGTAGDDVLFGGVGDDTLSGGLGNDTLYGGAGDDILINDGHGIDGLWGGTGNDTYQFAFGSEVVVGDPNLGFLNHVSDAEGEGSSDTLVFTNANFDDLQFMQGYKGFRPDHLYIRDIATNEVMGVSWQFSSADPASTAGIETFVFADGSYITRAELLTLIGGGTIAPHNMIDVDRDAFLI